MEKKTKERKANEKKICAPVVIYNPGINCRVDTTITAARESIK